MEVICEYRRKGAEEQEGVGREEGRGESGIERSREGRGVYRKRGEERREGYIEERGEDRERENV